MSSEFSNRVEALINARENGVHPLDRLQANQMVENEIVQRAEMALAHKTLLEECMGNPFASAAFGKSKEETCDDIATKLRPEYMEKLKEVRKLNEKSLRPDGQALPESMNQFAYDAGYLVDTVKPYIKGVEQLYRRLFSD